MRCFKTIRRRQHHIKDLYLKALRSGHFALDIGRNGWNRHTQNQLKVQHRQFIGWLASYMEALSHRGRLDRLFYGRMVRHQMATLVELKGQVQRHITSNGGSMGYIEHIDLSLLPVYVDIDSKHSEWPATVTAPFKCS